MVNAHAQYRILGSIQELLTETEAEIVRRGRNAHAKHPAPRNQNPDEYAASTGFEALFGFLYLTGQNERITELVSLLAAAEEGITIRQIAKITDPLFSLTNDETEALPSG